MRLFQFDRPGESIARDSVCFIAGSSPRFECLPVMAGTEAHR
jgi:hypothetical protein